MAGRLMAEPSLAHSIIEMRCDASARAAQSPAVRKEGRNAHWTCARVSVRQRDCRTGACLNDTSIHSHPASKFLHTSRNRRCALRAPPTGLQSLALASSAFRIAPSRPRVCMSARCEADPTRTPPRELKRGSRGACRVDTSLEVRMSTPMHRERGSVARSARPIARRCARRRAARACKSGGRTFTRRRERGSEVFCRKGDGRVKTLCHR